MSNMNLHAEITKAVEILRAGGLVAMPTETVYGLAADARNPLAVSKIFTAKQRPNSHPLIVHIAHSAALTDWAIEVPKSAYLLAERFWPGPLTLILKRRPEVLDLVTADQDTVALRIPRHPVASALLAAFGGGLVAPSANRFTRISPTTAAAVQEELGEAIDMVLDGGSCEVGLESTILDLSKGQPRILRPGMILPEAISTVLNQPVSVLRQDYPAEVRAPGMHHLHYAPRTPTKIVTTEMLHSMQKTALPAVLLTISDFIPPGNSGIVALKMPSNAGEYAHILYSTLRQLDQNQYQQILIEAVPDTAEWTAIRDRLTKASGQHQE